MIEYCCGYLFSPDFKQVLLIRKNRPVFLKGKLNGIGGKVESNESPDEAMIREFKEEAGRYITKWIKAGSLARIYGDNHIHVYYTNDSDLKAEAGTDEALEVWNVADLMAKDYNLEFILMLEMIQNHHKNADVV